MIVIDSSYALACLMPDERRPDSMDAVLREPLVAPFIWPVELANAMRTGLRRKRFNLAKARELAAVVADFDAQIVSPFHDDAPRYFESAMAHDLTSYDVLYIDLCLKQSLPLATRDEALTRAAARVGIRTWS